MLQVKILQFSPTCPLTTQHTIKQDARALANGQCKSYAFSFTATISSKKALSTSPSRRDNRQQQGSPSP